MLAERVGAAVEVAKSRRDGLTALAPKLVQPGCGGRGHGGKSTQPGRTRDWDEAEYAVPLVLNFSISSGDRLAREIKAALTRRESENMRLPGEP